MSDKDILMDTLKFHGHKCWASVAGVRAGLAALRTLGVPRSGGTQLYAIVEIGEEHGGMCFGDELVASQNPPKTQDLERTLAGKSQTT